MMLFYHLSIFLLTSGIRLAAAWNPKARAWVKGRAGVLDKVEAVMKDVKETKRIWIHCASLGEFEQGRPVLESLRRQYPQCFILLSFYSPSGYEVRKNYVHADQVFYLPADTVSNAEKFIEQVKPTLVIFVKYEYWLNYFRILQRKGIPLLMISAIFQTDQVFFKWYGGIWRKALSCVNYFFVQNMESGELLAKQGISNYSVVGDTRFDRVISIAENFEDIPLVRQFCGTGFVIVAGSTWPEDEEVWAHIANNRKDIKFILAPHELYEDNLKNTSKLFHRIILYSALENGVSADESNILVIDNFGLLSRLYHYADICFIGGGFGNGIHNILEAAVHGKPLLFGPVCQKFQEALDLLDLGGAQTVESAIELEKVVGQLLNNPDERKERGYVCRNYVQGKAGATSKILQYIQENRLLTS